MSRPVQIAEPWHLRPASANAMNSLIADWHPRPAGTATKFVSAPGDPEIVARGVQEGGDTF